jgi:hypothetical protein
MAGARNPAGGTCQELAYLVIASEAKQSKAKQSKAKQSNPESLPPMLDCFVATLLAMTKC